jgi:hypothetical protein
MLNLSANPGPADRELRREYARGIEAAISALTKKLSDGERQRIEIWRANKLTPWSQGRIGPVPPDFPRLD